jgi:hypothetical protein
MLDGAWPRNYWTVTADATRTPITTTVPCIATALRSVTECITLRSRVYYRTLPIALQYVTVQITMRYRIMVSFVIVKYRTVQSDVTIRYCELPCVTM